MFHIILFKHQIMEKIFLKSVILPLVDSNKKYFLTDVSVTLTV